MKAPLFAAVDPMAGGVARYVEKPDPLTVLLALRVVKAPVEAVVDPIGPGAANVAPPSVAALTEVLHANPVLVVQLSALADVEQLGIANAVTFAVDPVAFARTVFAACCARLPSVMPFVRPWNEYAPAPVRVRNPVPENPVMLSSAAPLADAELVPPLATGIGDESPEIVPPVMVEFVMLAFEIVPPETEIFGMLATPVTVRVGTVSGPDRLPPVTGRTEAKALFNSAAVRICPVLNCCALADEKTISSRSARRLIMLVSMFREQMCYRVEARRLRNRRRASGWHRCYRPQQPGKQAGKIPAPD